MLIETKLEGLAEKTDKARKNLAYSVVQGINATAHKIHDAQASVIKPWASIGQGRLFAEVAVDQRQRLLLAGYEDRGRAQVVQRPADCAAGDRRVGTGTLRGTCAAALHVRAARAQGPAGERGRDATQGPARHLHHPRRRGVSAHRARARRHRACVRIRREATTLREARLAQDRSRCCRPLALGEHTQAFLKSLPWP